MSETGTIKKWDESKGFGFIKSKQGKDIFVHASDCRSRLSFSSVGEDVEFKRSRDPKGRDRAINVRLTRQKKIRLPFFISLAAALGFVGCISYFVYINGYPIDVLYLIGAASILSILAYARDKSAARKGRWRVSENTLHLFSLLGGWPGAIVAQRMVNHKTSKQPFRSVFWITVLLNVAFIGWTFTHNGEYLLYSYLHDIKQVLKAIISTVR